MHALEACNTPYRLIEAVCRELTDCNLTFLFQNQVWPGTKLQRGGRQGGSDTPGLWVRYLDLAFSRAKKRWGDLGFGFEMLDVDFDPLS